MQTFTDIFEHSNTERDVAGSWLIKLTNWKHCCYVGASSLNNHMLSFGMHQAMIRRELNEFKSTEMDVHEESRKFTRLVF